MLTYKNDCKGNVSSTTCRIFFFFLDPNTCMDARMVIGIVFGSLVVVIFSVIVVVFMILRFHNLQKTIKPKD